MTARAAALYVCGHARDVDDARLLLTALGLLDGRLSWPAPGVMEVRNIRNIATSKGTEVVRLTSSPACQWAWPCATKKICDGGAA